MLARCVALGVRNRIPVSDVGASGSVTIGSRTKVGVVTLLFIATYNLRTIGPALVDALRAIYCTGQS